MSDIFISIPPERGGIHRFPAEYRSEMRFLFAYVKIDHRDHENNPEKDQRGRGGLSLTLIDEVIDITDHRVQTSGITRGTHIVTEDTDDGGIFLKSADEAGDDDVGDHGREQRDGDLGEDAPLGRAVDLGGVVVLLVDALQTAQQDQNLEGKRVPDDIEGHHENIVPIFRALIDPVDRLDAENAEDIVDNTRRLDQLVLTAEGRSDHVEHSRKDHTDGDRVGYVREKIDGLQESGQNLDGIEADSDQQRQQRRDRNGDHTQQNGVEQAALESRVGNDLEKVVNTNGKVDTAEPFHRIVAVLEGHRQGINDRPAGKNEKQNDTGGEIDPALPFIIVDPRQKLFDPDRDPIAFQRKVGYTHRYTSK